MYSYFSEHVINDIYDKYNNLNIISEAESEYKYNRYYGGSKKLSGISDRSNNTDKLIKKTNKKEN
ncbi:hypothetical protein [Howardella ureilytica]|nr:hypothetical protein [Lachnospiraceae bacterium]